MHYDYGFELPDIRDTFFTPDNGKVQCYIVRHWGRVEDDDPESIDFKIRHTDTNNHVTVTELPIGTDQSQAEKITRELYQVDEEATREWNECEEISRAEMRMGA